MHYDINDVGYVSRKSRRDNEEIQFSVTGGGKGLWKVMSG